ncbi:MAG: hypothetical protein SEPTF4163_005064 [Sporothrix epigloea]
MALQGTGDHNDWHMDYTHGSSYGLSSAGDDFNSFIDLDRLDQDNDLDIWPQVTDASGGPVQPEFDHETQHQFGLTDQNQLQQRLPVEYASLAGAQQPQQQEWQSYQNQSSAPSFQTLHHDGHATSSQSQGLTGHTPISFSGSQNLALGSDVLDGSSASVSGPMGNSQWQQQQQQQQQEFFHQQHADLQRQIQQQKQQQQQQQQHHKQQNEQVSNYSYNNPATAPSRTASASSIAANTISRTSASPAPRQSSITPDAFANHPHATNSPAPSNNYHSSAQNWQVQAQMQQQQLQPQVQEHQLQQQNQPQTTPQTANPPTSAPAVAAPPAKPAKATKPKTTKAAAAKVAQKKLQPEQAYQQQMFLGHFQQQPEQQLQLLAQQVQQQIPSEANKNGWQQQQQQQAQYGGLVNPAIYQQHQFINYQQQQAQSSPQQAQQHHSQQNQQQQQQPQVLDQSRQSQQMQMQRQQPTQSRLAPQTASVIRPPTIPTTANSHTAINALPAQAAASRPQVSAHSTTAVPAPKLPAVSPVPLPMVPGAAPVTAPPRSKPVKLTYKKPQIADAVPKAIPHLASAADTLERKQLFAGAPFLALGNLVEIEPPMSTMEPAVFPDPSKELGTKHFPGRKGRLPCEIIAEYDRLVSSQPPEKKEALVLELRSKLKSLGKILPPKVYKFASFGDVPTKKVTKPYVARGRPATMDLPGSDDESESEEEEEEVRSAVRPADPADAAAWDAIGIVHVTDNGAATIKGAVKNFGDFIKNICDGIKDAKEKLKKSEESVSAKKETIEALKRTLASRQELLCRAVEAADEKGNEQVLENLGGNSPLVANLVSVLRDCVNTNDFNGRLAKTLLRFMSQFTTVTDELLNQKLKFDKIQKRYMNKGDDEVKDLIGEIVAKTIHNKKPAATPTASTASAMTKTEAGSIKPPAASTAATKTASLRVSSDSLSLKRPREEDADSRPAKKSTTNSTSSNHHVATKAAASTSTAPATASAPAKPWAGTALLPGKTRPPLARPSLTKPEPPSTAAGSKSDVSSKDLAKLASNSSPSKRDTAVSSTTPSSLTGSGKTTGSTSAAHPLPSSSSTTIAAAAAASRAKKAAALAKAEQLATAASTGSSLGSQSKLGALLEEISKPKSTKGGVPAVSTPDSYSSSNESSTETPEQKAKRLRKESRRNLRVSWRTGNDLTEIRIFTKDEGEDEGRAKYLLRDAGDDRSEGLALKRSLKKKGMDDDDDSNGGNGDDRMNIDDEDGDELPYRPWFEASAISFSSLPVGKVTETYVTRGGSVEVDSTERQVMADRENTVLMAVYTDPSDMPLTPKSPPASHIPAENPLGGDARGVQFPTTDAKQQEVQMRWNEEQMYGSNRALWNAIQRLGADKQQEVRQPQPAQIQGAIMSFTGVRGSEVVGLLSSDVVKNWKATLDIRKAKSAHRWQDYTDPSVQKAVLALEPVYLQLQSKPFPATEPPEYITDSERIKEWWTGYNRDKQRERARAETAVTGGQSQNAAAAWATYFAQSNAQQPATSSTDADVYAQYIQAYYQQQQQQQQQQLLQQQQAALQAGGSEANAQLQELLTTLGGVSSAQQSTSGDGQSDAQLQAFIASMANAAYAGQPNAGLTDQSAYTQWPSGQQQQPLDDSQENQQYGDNKDRDGADANDQSNDGAKHSYRGTRGGVHRRGANAKKEKETPEVAGHMRGINRALIGTKACVFWASGKCAKGDKCTFRHD